MAEAKERELSRQLLRNQWARLNRLYKVVDRDSNVVPFRANWAQADLYRSMWYRNLILKARQIGFCLDPSTRVLTAELQWVQIADLEPGQQIVSVDEYPPGGRGRARKMRTATVQGVVEVYRKAYRITFDDGRSVVCTGKHPWLSKKAGTGTDWRTIESDNKKKLTPGTYVRWVTRPWDAPEAEDGWFGGMLDGEGSIANGNTSAGVTVAQREGAVWDRMVDYLDAHGYHYRIEDDNDRPSRFGANPVPKLAMGRMDELFRLVGQTRPSRFLGDRFWEGRELPGKRNGRIGWSRIESIEELGEQTLIDLQTDVGTYIAEGFVSHNTTFIDLFILDTCLFNNHVSAAIIAHTLEDAGRIFREKVKFPYDNLPEALQQARVTETEQSAELVFENGSSIRVTTSARSGTVQLLHISEYGRLAAKHPDKAQEIKSGSLEAVPQSGMVWVESTAEGQEGVFYDMAMAAQERQEQDRPLTRLDMEFHFYPWWKEPSYRLTAEEANRVVIGQRLQDYFDRLAKEYGIELDARQKAWYVLKEKQQGKDMLKEHPSTPEEAFQATLYGAYFARQLSEARQEGRVTRITPEKAVSVDTWWDLGVGDSTAIWFTQTVGREVWVVDYFEDSGEGIPYYIDMLHQKARERGWRYGTHTAPHDIAVREMGTGKSRWETAAQLGIHFEIANRPDRKEDAIQAARNFLGYCYFDEEHCQEGLGVLAAYRKEWDDKRGTWKNQPRHDWASHGADAFQVLASAHTFGPKHRAPRQIVVPSAKGWT